MGKGEQHEGTLHSRKEWGQEAGAGAEGVPVTRAVKINDWLLSITCTN